MLKNRMVGRAARIAKAAGRLAGYPLAYSAGCRFGPRPRAAQVALLSDGTAYTSEEQFAPLIAHRRQLRGSLGINVVPVRISDALVAPGLLIASFDVIFLKLGFRTPAAEVMRVVTTIRSVAPQGKLVYFDGDDDLCVQWPQILPLVDLYVKKHAFADPDRYSEIFVGKSNLTDYVHRTFGVPFADDPVATASAAVPAREVDKIMVGWNLALDDKIVNLRRELRGRAPPQAKENDIVCRAGVPQDWIFHLRKNVAPALTRLANRFRVIAPTERVTPDVYLAEMLGSKICISPFGYGEICWRDFEAILCGCLLMKPDMGHLRTQPNVFKPYETYVPVSWDFSDLEEKCGYYLSHPAELDRIAAAARQELERFYDGGAFYEQVGLILKRLGVAR